jgi:PAS domain S-box-containing protein
MQFKSPGILTRLSNLIIVQVIFIFVALALILFSPDADQDARNQLAELDGKLFDAGQRVADYMMSHWVSASAQAESDLNGFLATIPGVEKAALLRIGDSKSVAVIHAYHRGQAEKSTEIGDVSGFCDLDHIRNLVESDLAIGHGSFVNGAYLSHYCSWEKGDNPPTVLVVAAGHELSVSSRSNLKYAIFVLFLCSTLVSLLTVRLLTGKFKRPLDNIISAFDETAGGKLHHLNELEGDPQLGKLASAFNSMARKLWDHRRRIDEFVSRLAETNSELSRKQEFLSNLIDCSPLAVVVTDARRKIVLFSRAATETFGYAGDAVLGQDVKLLIARDNEAQPTRANKEDHREFEIVARRENGETFPLHVVSRRLETEIEGPVGRLYVCRDITESKNFQEMMIRLDRYYTKGEMAGDIAHEINNYLAVLMGNVELMPLMLKKGKMDKVESKLGVMKDTLEKIARFSDGLLDSPPETVRLEPTALNQVVENVIAFLKPQNKFDSVQVVTNLSSDLPVLQLDQMQVQQLLMNLIFNAAEALEDIEGERLITVTTRSSECTGKPGAEVEIRDNGTGVKASKEELLFRTRFTTKRRGHGIGLVTCRKIVDNHEGEIGYRFDRGSVFTVRFPVKELSPELAAFAVDGRISSVKR